MIASYTTLDTVNMGLVDYSDSDESGDEKPQVQPKPTAAKSNFSVDRSNPQKIRVKLTDTLPSNGTHEDEPAPKRAKLGGGFSGFNSMLPAPKRDADKPQASNKAPARKVFSLKTSAEAGFSRESDAEMRQFFAEQDNSTGKDADDVGLPDVPKKAPAAEVTTKGNTFMFKPLSVARGKKKKPAGSLAKPDSLSPALVAAPTQDVTPAAPPPKKKVSLFSSHQETDIEPATMPDPDPEDYNAVTSAYPGPEDAAAYQPASTSTAAGNQSLDNIASDLNLSAAERRQLFGRSGKDFSASSVVNFNTDQEYAANEAIRATGEQVQHNPVRAIAPGKHSLRQLVSAAQGQKDALEESFAAGRRNRKEAGSKYGW